MAERADFLVIGGGIAGASVAAALAETADVALLEREAQPGYHSTGRSAALYTETYGPPAIRGLTSASRAFLTAPPDGFADHDLLAPRGELVIAREGQEAALEDAFATGAARVPSLVRLGPEDARAIVPALRPEGLIGAIHEPHAMDIDVHGLHQGYLKLLRRRGGRVVCDAELAGLDRAGGAWTARLADGRTVTAAIVVNAAGAWAEAVGALAGAAPIGLVPKRRTAVTFAPWQDGAPLDPDSFKAWPMTVDVEEGFYFKPETGKLLVSPADETPAPASDIQPEELDIAVAIDRLEAATTLSARRLDHSWAGLRSFVPDKTPVVGYDDALDGFFWLAGQGGYGIQTAPALAATAAALAIGGAVPDFVAAHGVGAADLAPARLARVAAPEPVS
ncbi:MAG: FAD-dependent oxidoreductase [Azospirillaceae bacterium]